MYTILTPRSPRPTTDIPITAPPLNAIERALFIPPVLAAFAVLTLAFVATLIPKYPARIEQSVPRTNAIPDLTPIPSAISTNNTMMKITSILYSAVRNACAPSLMAAAISFILSVPSSSLDTFFERKRAKIRAITPTTGAK